MDASLQQYIEQIDRRLFLQSELRLALSLESQVLKQRLLKAQQEYRDTSLRTETAVWYGRLVFYKSRTHSSELVPTGTREPMGNG